MIFDSINENLCKKIWNMYEWWIWNEHNGWAQLLSQTSNQAKKRCDLLKSSKIHQGVDQEVWVRECKD